MKQYLSQMRLFVLVLFVVLGGVLYYKFVTDTLGFELITISPLVMFCLLFVLFTPPDNHSSYSDNLKHNFIQVFICTFLTAMLLSLYNFLRNLSPPVLSCEFYWEEGIDLELRRNNTFKARNTDLMSGEISYGRYRKVDNYIILKDPVKFGRAKMNDTLILTSEGLEFKLEKPWRVEGGTLRCK